MEILLFEFYCRFWRTNEAGILDIFAAAIGEKKADPYFEEHSNTL